MKYAVWIIVVFAVLLGLRLLNAGKAKRRAEAMREAAAREHRMDTMVRCVRCGVYLPRSEAKSTPAGPTCGESACAQRR